MEIDFSLILYIITSILNLIGKIIAERKKYMEKQSSKHIFTAYDPNTKTN